MVLLQLEGFSTSETNDAFPGFHMQSHNLSFTLCFAQNSVILQYSKYSHTESKSQLRTDSERCHSNVIWQRPHRQACACIQPLHSHYSNATHVPLTLTSLAE